MYVFGVDIGGTGVKSGIVNEKGEILIKSSVPTDKGHDYRVIVKDIAAQLVALCSESGIKIDEISGIGIGCPGAIDSAKGVVNYSNNLEWSYAPLSDEFENIFRCRSA
ncbi:MAG: ROK family protein [Christensenellales bacterium]